MPAARKASTIRNRINRTIKRFGAQNPKGGLGKGYAELSTPDRVLLAQRLQVAWGERGGANRQKAVGAMEKIIAGKGARGLDTFLESEEIKEMRYKMEELWESAGKETNYAFELKDKAALEGIRQKMISGSCNEKDYANLVRLYQKYLGQR
ncbi:MAG: hypothetical protein WC602_00725 [archaeon]